MLQKHVDAFGKTVEPGMTVIYSNADRGAPVYAKGEVEAIYKSGRCRVRWWLHWDSERCATTSNKIKTTNLVVG